MRFNLEVWISLSQKNCFLDLNGACNLVTYTGLPWSINYSSLGILRFNTTTYAQRRLPTLVVDILSEHTGGTPCRIPKTTKKVLVNLTQYNNDMISPGRFALICRRIPFQTQVSQTLTVNPIKSAWPTFFSNGVKKLHSCFLRCDKVRMTTEDYQLLQLYNINVLVNINNYNITRVMSYMMYMHIAYT